MGFQASLLRFIPAYRAQQHFGLLRGLLRYSNLLVFAGSILATTFGMILIWFLGNRIRWEQRHTFYIAFLLLPMFSLVKLRETGLRALKSVVQSQLLLNIIRPLILVIISVGLSFFIPENIKASSVMTGNLIAVGLVFCIGSVWLSKLLPQDIRDYPAVYKQKEWMKVSLPLLLIVGMSLILKRTDIIMLGAIRGPKEAGFYSAATNISNLLFFGSMAVNTILAPIISELFHMKKNEDLQRIVAFSARGIFAFTVIAGILLVIFGKYFLSFFGHTFVVAYIPLLILLSGRIVNSLTGPAGLLMTMTCYHNQAGCIVAIGASINIILNSLLIPLMGLNGAAIATATSLSLSNIVMLTYVWKKLRINPTILS